MLFSDGERKLERGGRGLANQNCPVSQKGPFAIPERIPRMSLGVPRGGCPRALFGFFGTWTMGVHF